VSIRFSIMQKALLHSSVEKCCHPDEGGNCRVLILVREDTNQGEDVEVTLFYKVWNVK
jgi:hypothetical protein